MAQFVVCGDSEGFGSVCGCVGSRRASADFNVVVFFQCANKHTPAFDLPSCRSPGRRSAPMSRQPQLLAALLAAGSPKYSKRGCQCDASVKLAWAMSWSRNWGRVRMI